MEQKEEESAATTTTEVAPKNSGKRKRGTSRALSSRQEEFWRSKFRMSLDYIFGRGTSRKLNFSDLSFIISSRTGRLRHVAKKNSGEVLFSFRPNGSIAPTVSGAGYLLAWSSGGGRISKARIKARPRWTITVIDGVTEFVSGGKTVFCKHIVHCDDSLRANEDVVVLNEGGELLAVGRSIIAGPLMKQFKRGVAVKVRQGRTSRGGSSELNATDEL